MSVTSSLELLLCSFSCWRQWKKSDSEVLFCILECNIWLYALIVDSLVRKNIWVASIFCFFFQILNNFPSFLNWYAQSQEWFISALSYISISLEMEEIIKK